MKVDIPDIVSSLLLHGERILDHYVSETDTIRSETLQTLGAEHNRTLEMWVTDRRIFVHGTRFDYGYRQFKKSNISEYTDFWFNRLVSVEVYPISHMGVSRPLYEDDWTLDRSHQIAFRGEDYICDFFVPEYPDDELDRILMHISNRIAIRFGLIRSSTSETR